MFRRVVPCDSSIFRAVIFVLIGIALFLLTTGVADASEPASSTPTAWEYSYEMATAPVRQPAVSTSADLQLATGLSIAAVIVVVAVVLSDRDARTADSGAEPTHVPVTSVRPSSVRPFGPAESMPEAA